MKSTCLPHELMNSGGHGCITFLLLTPLQKGRITLRCGLQHTVVTENDHKERGWAFFAPAKCHWFREFEAQITSNSCHELKHDTIFEWRCVLKMNFSGTTN